MDLKARYKAIKGGARTSAPLEQMVRNANLALGRVDDPHIYQDYDFSLYAGPTVADYHAQIRALPRRSVGHWLLGRRGPSQNEKERILLEAQARYIDVVTAIPSLSADQKAELIRLAHEYVEDAFPDRAILTRLQEELGLIEHTNNPLRREHRRTLPEDADPINPDRYSPAKDIVDGDPEEMDEPDGPPRLHGRGRKKRKIKGGAIDEATYLKRQASGVYPASLSYSAYLQHEKGERQRVDRELADLAESNAAYEQFYRENPDQEPVMCNLDENLEPKKNRTTQAECNRRHEALHKRKWDADPFGKIVNGLTAVADFAVDKLPLPSIVKQGYKKLGPPTSKFYEGDNVWHKLTGTGMNRGKLQEYLKKKTASLFN